MDSGRSSSSNSSSSLNKPKQLQEQTLRVAQAELASLKDGRAVYVKKGNLFFSSSKPAAVKHIADSLAKHEGSKQQQQQ
uniref:Prefoldin subunit 1 n=1 Tax=Tetradesmus obliquus TaxID=3088 RepID=A0A383WM41_TETOB|eukprot:jgi/Sobl393_1/633/SZX78515.1